MGVHKTEVVVLDFIFSRGCFSWWQGVGGFRGWTREIEWIRQWWWMEPDFKGYGKGCGDLLVSRGTCWKRR